MAASHAAAAAQQPLKQTNCICCAAACINSLHPNLLLLHQSSSPPPVFVFSMPLLLMCGYPSSGKTTHAHAIARQLTERGCRVSIVNDESLGLIRAEAYGNPASEKIARGLLKAAVEQLLSKEQVVIADGCNYIKGFRYELYCGLRLVGSTHAVVHCAADVATCAAWDAARAAAGGDSWGEVLLRDYAARFEAPNDRQRWDRSPNLPCVCYCNHFFIQAVVHCACGGGVAT